MSKLGWVLTGIGIWLFLAAYGIALIKVSVRKEIAYYKSIGRL